MIALAKWVIRDLSVKVLEYPEITKPEQGLKLRNKKLFYTTQNQNLMQVVKFGNVKVWLHSISFWVMQNLSCGIILF